MGHTIRGKVKLLNRVRRVRGQVEALERAVERASTRFSEAALLQFADEVKAAREGAAQRLSRELDRAVANFARQAEAALGARLSQVADAGEQRLEKRQGQMAAGLERQREEAVAALERRLAEAEDELRRHIRELAADGEAERNVLEARLHELQRRVDQAMQTVERNRS